MKPVRLLRDSLSLLKYPWLRRSHSIFTHLTVAERTTLYELASDRADGNLVEIGSYLGASSYALAAGVASRGGSGKVYCIDTWYNDAMSEGGRDTMTEFLRNTATYSSTIVPVRGYSTDVVDQIASQTGGIDLLFIDGDHAYEGCRADWLAYKSLLKPGGIVVCHDIGWAEGVQRVVREEIGPQMKKVARLPNMWWGWLA